MPVRLALRVALRRQASYDAIMTTGPDVAIAADGDPTLGLVIYAQTDTTEWATIVAAVTAFASSMAGATLDLEPMPSGSHRGARVGRVTFASRLSRAQAEAAASTLCEFFADAGIRV